MVGCPELKRGLEDEHALRVVRPQWDGGTFFSVLRHQDCSAARGPDLAWDEALDASDMGGIWLGEALLDFRLFWGRPVQAELFDSFSEDSQKL